MIKKIFKNFLLNFQVFLITWVIVIIVNQIFIFGACFAPYCILAALPHTFVIAIILSYFINDDKSNETKKTSTINSSNSNHFTQIKSKTDEDEFEETEVPFCPKCGSKMVLRTATKGQHLGNKFWGCSKYPNCKGLLNL